VEECLITLKIVHMAKIQKNKSNYLIIEQKEYEGNPYVDVRECYDNEEGERQFTKKGITFNPKIAEQVAEAILQAIKQ